MTLPYYSILSALQILNDPTKGNKQHILPKRCSQFSGSMVVPHVTCTLDAACAANASDLANVWSIQGHMFTVVTVAVLGM